jgi:hypothetical protein
VSVKAALLRRALAGNESSQALVLLAAGRAAFEVGSKPGDGGVGVLARHFEPDVAVELLEALVTARFRRNRIGAIVNPVQRSRYTWCAGSVTRTPFMGFVAMTPPPQELVTPGRRVLRSGRSGREPGAVRQGVMLGITSRR